jgi:hypothetical protein
MLSNLETEKSKLLQIVLVGQPNLRDKLASPELEQLRQRITVSYHLDPLDAGETANYINHRLRRAALGAPLEFPQDVTDAIHARSRGMPRIINVICDAALVFGYAEERHQVDLELMRDVLGELEATGVLGPSTATGSASAEAPALRRPRPSLRDAGPAPEGRTGGAGTAVLPPPAPAGAERLAARAAELEQREQSVRQRERELAEQRRILAEEYRLLRTRAAPPAQPVETVQVRRHRPRLRRPAAGRRTGKTRRVPHDRHRPRRPQGRGHQPPAVLHSRRAHERCRRPVARRHARRHDRLRRRARARHDQHLRADAAPQDQGPRHVLHRLGREAIASTCTRDARHPRIDDLPGHDRRGRAPDARATG